MTVPGSVIAGRYRLVSQIAAGGMGSVWEAADQLLQRTVAIKQLLPQAGLDDDELAMADSRVIREARITARLHHPHAVTLYDVVEHDGRPCLVMQFVPSKSLDALLRERGPFEVPFVARIGAEVASALAAAHRVGIVHRDVKPGNVLITPQGSANITDFGISHAVGDVNLTSTGMLTGTPAYLAPEVARGAESSFSADVFSLGATLYAALEGTPPFGNDTNPMAVLHRVASGQLVPPRRSGILAPLLLHMLAPEPKYRPAMSDVALRLSEAASSAAVEQPAPAPAPGPVPRQQTVVSPIAEPQLALHSSGEQQAAASGASESGTGGLPFWVPAASPDAARNRKIRPLAAMIGAVLVTAIVLATALFLGRDRATTATPPTRSEQPVLISSGVSSSSGSSFPGTAAAGPAAVPPPGTADSAAPSAQPSTAPATTVSATTVATPVATKPAATPVATKPGTTAVATKPVASRTVPAPVSSAASIRTAATGSTASTAKPTKSPSSKPTPVARTTTSVTASRTSTTAAATSTSATAPRTSTTTSAQGPPTASELSSALTGYYDLMPNDTAAGWNLLTANFQNGIAHGRDNYQNYWDGVESVSVSQVDAQPPNTVVATISYRLTNGKTSVERTQYDLVRQDGVLKIDNSSVVG